MNISQILSYNTMAYYNDIQTYNKKLVEQVERDQDGNIVFQRNER